MGGMVMLFMFACQMNSFGMDTENTKRVIQYLSYRAGLQETKRLQDFDEKESVANTEFCIYTGNGLPWPYIKIGFDFRNVISSGKNLAYILALARQNLTNKPLETMMLKEKIDIKNKDKVSVWGVKRRKIHIGRMYERKFQLQYKKN